MVPTGPVPALRAVSQDVFAVLLILLPPLLFMATRLARNSPRPVVRYGLIGIYVVFGILMPLRLGWMYFREEFWSVAGLLLLFNGLFWGGVLSGWRQQRAAGQSPPTGRR